jgi:hypothetical protein
VDDDLDDYAVGTNVPLLDRAAVPVPGEHLPEQCKVSLKIVRMREVGERGTVEFRKRYPDELRGGVVTPQDASVDVDDRDPDRSMVEGEVEQREPDLGSVFDRFRLHAASCPTCCVSSEIGAPGGRASFSLGR